MTNLRKWQIVGTGSIVITYIFFVLAARDKANVWCGWSMAMFVGIVELVTIFVYHSNITRFWRNMYGRPADLMFLFGLVPLTWWLAGELAAGFLLLGWLNSHFHEYE